MDPILSALAEQAGIHFMGVDAQFQLPGVAMSTRIAQDAQPLLITTPNSGIPSYLTMYIDPKAIDILVAPMKAAEIAGDEIKKGDWLTDTAMFPVVESTGETSAYGDFSNNGKADANVIYPQRQSYHYQVVTQWGERELERMGLARIDWANRKNIASILTLNKFQNKSYFFGVSGLENFGLLNDPSLIAPIAPATKTEGGVVWGPAAALEVYQDVTNLYEQLVSQANGLIDINADTAMTLALPPVSAVNFKKTSQFNVNVEAQLKTNFPNMKIITAPEYATTSGNLVQLIVDEMEGQRTVSVAFTEKLRAHPIVIEMSSFKQKKSQGTFGAIVYRPFLIAQMLGV